MITLHKVTIYDRYGGDIDGFCRSADADDPEVNDEDWKLIDILRMRLTLVARGLASSDFAAKNEQQLLEVAADEETREALRRMD